jgi:hypothetical protein
MLIDIPALPSDAIISIRKSDPEILSVFRRHFVSNVSAFGVIGMNFYGQLQQSPSGDIISFRRQNPTS